MTAVLTDSIVSTTGPQVGWQPIETAPRDGTEILACRPDCGVFLARFVAPCEFLALSENLGIGLSDEDWQTQDWFFADFVSGGRVTDGAPTHWMPLPLPPTDTRETDAEPHPGTVSHEPSPTDTQG